MAEIRAVRLAVLVAGEVTHLDSAGVEVRDVPGLLITPFYRAAQAVRDRFSLTHAGSGLALTHVALTMDAAARWGETAGRIGVDWTADADTIRECGPARVLAWRIADES